LQADLKTFSAFGVHGLTAVTAVVAETPRAVHAIHPLSPAAVQEQVRILLECYPVAAIKTGMLGSKAHVVAIAELLAGRAIPLVVDPVMVASSGAVLLAPDAVAAYRERLCPLATVITPNLPEAMSLSRRGGEPDASTLAAELGCAVLLTGGHAGSGEEVVDVLSDRATIHEFRGPRVAVEDSHGTGCTLSAAITANLALGEDLVTAIGLARVFVTRALRESYAWPQGATEELRAINQLPQARFAES
jgi:hydroxymethylpyrimidine/phosphomethylpyrimidine kinase